MTYAESQEEQLDVESFDYDSLVEQLGFETVLAVANDAYGRPIDTDEPVELYNHLWSYQYLDNFLDGWYFKANYYNKFKDYPDVEDVQVILKENA